MALHLHVICKASKSDSSKRANLKSEPSRAGVFRSGVWKLASADARTKPDFIWLHEDMNTAAYMGGPVSSFASAVQNDCTTGDEPQNGLDGRYTFTFEKQSKRPESPIRWRGDLKQNSYALADDAVP